jgi:MFS family permease
VRTPSRPLLAALALAGGLALADASVVALALPPIVGELNASVRQAAAVLGAYALALGVSLPGALWLRRRVGAHACGAAGFALMAAASVGCALAGSVGVLLVFRALQAAGAAGGLLAVAALLPRRAWHAVSVFGTAAGPALGGVLTQAIDWRAVFWVQLPIAAAGGAAAWLTQARPSGERLAPATPRSLAALGLVSAALVGVLFLLVLLLATGWGLSPLAAAATVSVLPVAALAGARLPPNPAAGAALLGGGVIWLAAAPGAHPWWTIPPQIVAGVGMGLSLPALSDAGHVATQLAARHAGIVVALAIIAPIASHELDVAVHDTRLRGAALILDARLPPLDKLSLVSTVTAPVDPQDPRGSLRDALDAAAPRFDRDPAERAAYAHLSARADDALVDGVDHAVRPSLAPKPVGLADPCRPRALPHTGGLTGAAQDAALTALDRAACRWGSSREELALALVDDQDASDYRREYGHDPRSLLGILRAVLSL